MFNTEKIEKLQENISCLEKEIETLKGCIGKKELDMNDYFSRVFFQTYSFNYVGNCEKTTNEPTIIQRLEAIEKHFNIKWVSEKTEFKGYKPAKKEKAPKAKKAGRPKKSK